MPDGENGIGSTFFDLLIIAYPKRFVKGVCEFFFSFIKLLDKEVLSWYNSFRRNVLYRTRGKERSTIWTKG